MVVPSLNSIPNNQFVHIHIVGGRYVNIEVHYRIYIYNYTYIVGDLLISLSIPVRMAEYHYWLQWSSATCWLHIFIRLVAIFVSINTLILVSRDRYFAIVKPHLFKVFVQLRHVYKPLAFVWGLSALETIYPLTQTRVSQ
jgi:hypothetical protein